MSEEATTYDYIIVGGGSAGCVLANRLSADGRHRVLLIEAGGDDRPLHNLRRFIPSSLIHVPVGFATNMFDPEMTWGFASEPAPHAAGRNFDVIRGRVLGGSSAINAMLFVRGEAYDYDRWAQAGCSGWGWRDVLPYFVRAEHQERPGDEWHGVRGPVYVSNNRLYPALETALETAELMGIPRSKSFFTGTQFGSGPTQLSLRRGRRISAATAYLNTARRRRNLRIVTDTQVLSVSFDGRRATGVNWVCRGQRGHYGARAEVILAAGAIGSPQLLELSGIGGAERLTALGIEVRLDRPAIGENLQDHYYSPLTVRLKKGATSSNVLSRPPHIYFEMLKYALTRRGLMSSSAVQAFIYARSPAEMGPADLQFSLTPGTLMAQEPGSRMLASHRWPGLTLATCQLRPFSRGHVHIRSGEPSAYPEIQLGFLADERDREIQLAGVRLGRAILNHPHMRSCVEQEESPGVDVEDDETLLNYIREKGSSVYHPVGSVRMGSDPDAPLDARLRVRDVAGLRVVDASIMPHLVSGNTNAPTIMIAEKASHMILEDAAATRAR